MANIIFYFTGTGNSLAVARDIAVKIGATKVVSVADAMRESNIDLTYERIGFVFPVYYARVPSIVKQFITKLNFNKSQYVFGVVTYGGTQGKALRQLNNLITEQGGTLSAGFSCTHAWKLYSKLWGFPKINPTNDFQRKSEKSGQKSPLVLNQKQTLVTAKGDLGSGVITRYIEKIMAGFGKRAQNFQVNGKCTGCSLCEIICPVGNIKMENEQPKWGNGCEQCMACIQWCPVQAIEYADKTAKRKRYRNPEIRISDLISSSATKDVKLKSE